MSLDYRSAEKQQACFVELRHRYANALQLAVSLLVRQARRCREEAVAQALHAAAARLHAVHHLYFALDADGIEAPQAARAFLEALCHHLAAAYLADTGVRCDVDADDARLTAGTCRLLGLAVHELVVNAAKHAFPGRDGGQVVIRLLARLPGHWCCSVEDDGVGFGATASRQGGLGRTLVSDLAGQMGGASIWETRADGGSVHLTFVDRTDGPGPAALDGAAP